MTRDIEAEFLLRSLAIDMLEICSKNGIKQADISVVPNGRVGDLWVLQFMTDGKSVQIRTSTECEAKDVEEQG